MIPESLGLLCDRVGLARGYWDITGFWREPRTEDLIAILNALGIDPQDEVAPIPHVEDGAPPLRCHAPAASDPSWGLSVQLYAVRSSRNWGIGDYTDLADLARLAGAAGADLLGINPLHGRSLTRPAECSPYSPVSRLALDTLAIDVEAIDEFATSPEALEAVSYPEIQERLAAARASPLVDYVAVTRLKAPFLRLLHGIFLERASAERQTAYRDFVTEADPAVADYAAFEALRWYHDPRIGPMGWWDWPAEPKRAAPELADEIAFQLWLQFIADQQLSKAADAGRQAGMRIGLYRDLAVGAARDGAEAWSAPSLASPLSVGAPPDPLGELGQNWGVPAPDPRGLAAAGYAPFRSLVRANMRHAGAIRIDHAMSLARLFVIAPGGTGRTGTYLAYPFDILTRILAEESQARRCLVIGEDLGTVPDGFREACAARAILSYKVMMFERYHDGALRGPADYPPLSLATACTHDLPPLTGYWAGVDIDIREAIGLVTDRVAAEEDRRHERDRFLTLFDWLGVQHNPPPDREGGGAAWAVDGMHRLIATAASALAMVQLDDLLGETKPVNIPGTGPEYPNWRRKISLAIDDPDFAQRLEHGTAAFRAARPRRTRNP